MDPARLAIETVLQQPTKGIPTFGVHLMEHAHIERLAGVEPGSYRREPEKVYLACKLAIGVYGRGREHDRSDKPEDRAGFYQVSK